MSGDTSETGFEDGALWRLVEERTARALARGAQVPVATETEVVSRDGVDFVVHILARLGHEQRAREEQRRARANPFRPHDRDLFVADLSASHLCVLNKFNVLRHHLLIITRDFVDQESPLDLRDFAALWVCLREDAALGFYNAGTVAGASQAHRHLQLVPLPLTPGRVRIPVEPLLEPALTSHAVSRSQGLPFRHALLEIEQSAEDPVAVLHDGYLRLCRALDLDRRPRPYNLLATREWMLVVPRSRECFESMSVNALGLAGSLLVRNRAQLERVHAVGPMEVLRSVTEPA